MQLVTFRLGLFAALLATTSACTVFDGLSPSGSDATGSGTTATDGAGKGLGSVAPSGKCVTGADCASAICASDGTCTGASITDGVKNGTETDIDCGGADAPKCEATKTCTAATDCFWGFCTSGTCEGHMAGRKDGDETDIDCGGTKSPACDWDKACALDKDCTSTACGANLKCLVGPSCKAVAGGTSCGTGETGQGGAVHESCCKSLPVASYTTGLPAGKTTVYLDKYEITAGRMRTFLAAVAAANGGAPNVKAYIAANKPTWWKTGWEDALPQAQTSGQSTYTVTNPTSNVLYPGDDIYATNTTQGNAWHVVNGTYSIDTSVVFAMGGEPWYPEFQWTVNPDPTEGPGYAQFHNFNCNNEEGSSGFGTYYFDAASQKLSDPQNLAKAFTQDQMDEKALNCAPTALFAAFCAWDGGQLMTKEVFDYVAGGTWVDYTGQPTIPAAPPRLAKGPTLCGGDNSIITMKDSSQSCDSVYGFPDAAASSTHDASYKVAAPGRITADSVQINAADEPWMDLIGNLQEIVAMPDGSFDGRGYGIGWSSSIHHRLQMSLPRFKEGSFGTRCMRFK